MIKKICATIEMLINDVPCDDRVRLVNHANECFTNIGSNLGRNLTDSSYYLSYFPEAMNQTFSFEAVTLEVLAKIVKSLKGASPGYEDLPV